MPVADSDVLIKGPDFERLTRIHFSPEAGDPVRKVYSRKQKFGWFHDSPLVVGPWLYSTADHTLEAVGVDAVPEVHVELKHGTGGYGSMVFADGRLYVLGSEGRLALGRNGQPELHSVAREVL